MRISRQVCEILDRVITNSPPETGGIFGSEKGDLIDNIIFDTAVSSAEPCMYAPNVDFLNQNIQIWQKGGISFKGIFHTHFCGVETLSQGDRKYINEIMCAMPQQLNALYFPVYVLPDRELVCYKAVRSNGIIDIQAEDLIIE